MAGERQPASSSDHGMPGDGSRVGDGDRERSLNDKAGHAGKGGKLRLSRPALFKRKPYDRPGNPGTLDRPFPSGSTASFSARFVDSASNFLTSSASYLFESFFKRRKTLWIGNGDRSTGRTSSADLEPKEGERPDFDNSGEDAIAPSQGPVLEEHHEIAKGEDVDFARVEGILKQQSLSREDVKRLINALQRQPRGCNVVGYGSKSDGQHIKKKKVDEVNPVQLAKVFMNEHSSHLVSGTPLRTPYRYGDGAGPSTVKRIKETIDERNFRQGSTVLPASTERMKKRGLIAADDYDDVLRVPTRRVRQRMTIAANSSPYIRQVTMASGPLRTSTAPLLQLSEKPEKGQEALEECPKTAKPIEEPVAVVTCSDTVPAESSGARENSETLLKENSVSLPTSRDLDHKAAEEPEPTTDPKAVEKSAVGSQVGSATELPTNVPERTKGFHMSAFFEDSSSDEDSEPVVKKSTSGEAEQSESFISQKGPQPDSKKQPFVCLPNEGSVLGAVDFSIKASPTSWLTTTVTGSSNHSAGTTIGSPPVAALSPSFVASSSAMGKSIGSVSNVEPFTFASQSPLTTEKEAPSPVVLSASRMPASPPGHTPLPVMPFSVPVQGEASGTVVELETASPMSVSGGVAAEERGLSPAPAPASPPTVTRATETSIATTSDTALAATSKVAVPLARSVSPTVLIASTGAVSAIASTVFQVGSTRGAHAAGTSLADSSLDAGRGGTSVSGSPASEKLSDGDTMATDPMTEEPASSFAPSSASPFSFGSVSTSSTSLVQQPSFMSNTASTPSLSFPTLSSSLAPGANSLIQFPLTSQSSGSSSQLFTFGASGTSFPNPFSVSTQSSFSFGSSSDTMASAFTATPPTPPAFPATASTPSFQFVAPLASSASSASMSLTSMFGAQMTPSASAVSVPGGQNTTPAFGFSAPPISSATTVPLPSPFQFGGASASTPSFGGQAFLFGAQPGAANPFAQSGASNASPFQFGSSAAAPSQSAFSSGAASPPAFSFGAQPTGSPFSFTFGGQAAAPSIGQPFGGQAAAPSTGQPFGGQAAAPSTGQPFGSQAAALSSGQPFGGQQVVAPSTGQAFGSQQVVAPSTGQPFGGPAGSPSTGQPFSFGGQPGALAQGSFPSAGSTGQNPFAPPAGASGMDFGGGGFSLGVAGGERAGRKFFKAKRSGGAKRGK